MIYSKKEDEAYEVLFDTYQYNREYAVKRINDIAMKMMEDKNMQNYLRENKKRSSLSSRFFFALFQFTRSNLTNK